jgi:methionine-rich copper-binding protein CopC
VLRLLLLALALRGQALAHASLLGSEPVDGASLAAPASVVLPFDEEVTLIALRLAGPDGRGVPLGSVDGARRGAASVCPGGWACGRRLYPELARDLG